MHLFRKAPVDFDLLETNTAFVSEQRVNCPRLRMAGVQMAQVDPKRAAMRRQLLDVENSELMASRHTLNRHQREVGKVLVVDGIKLVLLDQPLKMRELQGDHTTWRQ